LPGPASSPLPRRFACALLATLAAFLAAVLTLVLTSLAVAIVLQMIWGSWDGLPGGTGFIALLLTAIAGTPISVLVLLSIFRRSYRACAANKG
jgi:ABC-type Co2+ transport system permease subunit